jgi:hypothetical protein
MMPTLVTKKWPGYLWVAFIIRRRHRGEKSYSSTSSDHFDGTMTIDRFLVGIVVIEIVGVVNDY